MPAPADAAPVVFPNIVFRLSLLLFNEARFSHSVTFDSLFGTAVGGSRVYLSPLVPPVGAFDIL